MKRLLLAAVICLLASACGAAGAASGPSPSPTSTGRGVGFDITATDSVHALTMRSGEKLEVVLHASNGMTGWVHPQSSDTTILAPTVDPAATAARGVTLAAFQALRPGTAEITATASALCSPGQACPAYEALYSLKVTVTP